MPRKWELEELRQRHDNSCGQTCVAMLSGTSYNRVIKQMGKSYTSTRAIHDGLKYFGVRSAKRLVQFRGNKKYPDHRKLGFDAMLKLVHPKVHRGGNFHWVVWDAKKRKVLDPQRPRYKIRQVRITSFLPISRSPHSK
jgi:hypothetical protein